MKRLINKTILLSMAVMLAACNQKKDETAANPQAAKDAKPEVKIEQVFAQNVAQTETYAGTVESNIKNSISPNAPYRIKKIYYDVGDYVKKGAVVVDLDKTSVSQSNIQIENQKLAIENARLQMENQQVEFNRTAELYNIGGVSKSEYDGAKLMYDQTVIAYENAQKQLGVLRSQTGLLEENTRLVAPMDGIVTARNYDDGDMYASMPVLTIEQTNPVKLIIKVSEQYYGIVKEGMGADVSLDAYPDQLFRGTVVTIYPTIDQITHTFPVELFMSNDKQQIRPGMYARARLNRARLNMSSSVHVMVPDIAVVKQIGAGDRYVYVYKDGKVSYNKVEIGQHVGDKFEIISGVEDGDMVVVAGMARLANGKEVEVVK